MMGSGGALDQDVYPEDYGLIPRICSGLFDKAEQVLYKIKSPFGHARMHVVDNNTGSAKLGNGCCKLGCIALLYNHTIKQHVYHGNIIPGLVVSLSGIRADDKM